MAPRRVNHIVRKFSRALFALPVALVFAACGDAAMVRIATLEVDARARAYLGLVARQQVDSALARVSNSLIQDGARDALVEMASAAAGATFDSMHVIGAQRTTINGVTHTNITYEYYEPVGWHVANVAWVDSANSWFVEGASIEAIPEKLETLHAFRSVPLRPHAVAWIVLMMLSAGLSLGSAVLVATRRGMPRRVLWALVALLGLGAFRLHWTTGATDAALLQVVLFAAGAGWQGDAAPVILTFSVPVGAFIALGRWRRWQRGKAGVTSSPANAEVLLHEEH